MSDKLRECPIYAVEIFSGKDEKWKGWYNFFETKTGICISGPNPPESSRALLKIIENWNTRHEPNHETVEQWEERTGEIYPDDGPVWYLWDDIWKLAEYWMVKKAVPKMYNVRVANHHGKPE